VYAAQQLEMHDPKAGHEGGGGGRCTQFTSFTGTKVQIRTQLRQRDLSVRCVLSSLALLVQKYEY
jgi:hypothetical protein